MTKQLFHEQLIKNDAWITLNINHYAPLSPSDLYQPSKSKAQPLAKGVGQSELVSLDLLDKTDYDYDCQKRGIEARGFHLQNHSLFRVVVLEFSSIFRLQSLLEECS